MKGQGKVKGILVEGNDGHEYLLGFGPLNVLAAVIVAFGRPRATLA